MKQYTGYILYFNQPDLDKDIFINYEILVNNVNISHFSNTNS